MQKMRIDVAVIVKHDIEGKALPLAVIWKDGRKFEVDRVSDIRRAASLKAGGVGLRYTCRIRNKEVFLFDEEGRWFLEA